jgi:hypothetical protein
MTICNSIFFDDQTWSYLKQMAHTDIRSTSNFIQVLVIKEWESRQVRTKPSSTKVSQPKVAPVIPSTLHINQGN